MLRLGGLARFSLSRFPIALRRGRIFRIYDLRRRRRRRRPARSGIALVRDDGADRREDLLHRRLVRPLGAVKRFEFAIAGIRRDCAHPIASAFQWPHQTRRARVPPNQYCIESYPLGAGPGKQALNDFLLAVRGPEPEPLALDLVEMLARIVLAYSKPQGRHVQTTDRG